MSVASGSTLFGAFVSLIGLYLIVLHVRSRKRDRHAANLEEKERVFREHRYRRRLQTSSLVTLLGGLLALFEVLPLARSPLNFTAYVSVLLLLTLWLVLLALSDLMATRAHSWQRFKAHRDTRESLEKAMWEVRQASRLSASKKARHD